MPPRIYHHHIFIHHIQQFPNMKQMITQAIQTKTWTLGLLILLGCGLCDTTSLQAQRIKLSRHDNTGTTQGVIAPPPPAIYSHCLGLRPTKKIGIDLPALHCQITSFEVLDFGQAGAPEVSSIVKIGTDQDSAAFNLVFNSTLTSGTVVFKVCFDLESEGCNLPIMEYKSVPISDDGGDGGGEKTSWCTTYTINYDKCVDVHDGPPVWVGTIGISPNPTAGYFRVSYQLNETTYMKISLRNPEGGYLSTLVRGKQEPGAYNISSDALVKHPAGTYHLVFETEGHTLVKTLLKN